MGSNPTLSATQSTRQVGIPGVAAILRKMPENSPLNIARLPGPDPETRLHLEQAALSGHRSPLGTIACQIGSIGGVPKYSNLGIGWLGAQP